MVLKRKDIFFSWSQEEKESKFKKMEEIAARGGHHTEMMPILEIRSEDTFYRWKREIPEFAEQLAYCKVLNRIYYEQTAREIANGDLPKASAQMHMMLMHNKFPEDYKRNALADTNKIEANTVNILNVSSGDLDYKIAQKLELLKTYGILPEVKTIEIDEDR